MSTKIKQFPTSIEFSSNYVTCFSYVVFFFLSFSIWYVVRFITNLLFRASFFFGLAFWSLSHHAHWRCNKFAWFMRLHKIYIDNLMRKKWLDSDPLEELKMCVCVCIVECCLWWHSLLLSAKLFESFIGSFSEAQTRVHFPLEVRAWTKKKTEHNTLLCSRNQSKTTKKPKLWKNQQ